MPASSRVARAAGSCVAGVVLLVALLPAVAARAADPVAMVVDLVTRDDAEFRAIGLERVRIGVKGEAATRAIAALLEKLPAARQAELVRALADRGDPAALPAFVALLDRAEEPAARAAAIAAVGMLGSAEAVPVLLKSLAAGGPEQAAARRALTAIRGDAAVGQIVAAAKSGDPKLRPVLIDVITDRRVRSALPDLAALATDGDAAVRQAALKALGGMGGAAQVPAMIAGLLAATPGGERQAAERAVVAVCTRNPGHEEAAKAFLDAFKAATEADQESLLPALGAIGGGGALAIIDGMVADAEAGRRQFGLKALARWPDATVAPRLIDLVGKARDQAERDLVLGALIRIAPLPDNKLDDAKKLDLVKRTMELCATDAERARLLERAGAIRTFETFQFVAPFLDQPALAAPACKSVVELAHHQNLRDAHKSEFLAALDKVIATTQDSELVERATRYKEGKTWERKR